MASAGELIGTIADLDNTTLAEIRAPHAVVVHEMMPRRLVSRGDRFYHLPIIAEPVPPQKRMVSYEPERHDPPFPSWLVERPSMRAASVRGAGATVPSRCESRAADGRAPPRATEA